ncbi:helix-turn-helix transcriptional regulator [Nocardia arizonensis]
MRCRVVPAASPDSQSKCSPYEHFYGRAGEHSERLVDPWGLVDKDGIWYLVAGTERGERTFRVDRITEATDTDETAHRPADFDLSSAWDQVVDAMEQRRSMTAATVLIAPELLPVLRDQQGRHCEVEGPVPDGRTRVRVTAPTPRMIAQQLAGWGAEIEVVAPRSVRDELTRIGAELVDRYARDPARLRERGHRPADAVPVADPGALERREP